MSHRSGCNALSVKKKRAAKFAAQMEDVRRPPTSAVPRSRQIPMDNPIDDTGSPGPLGRTAPVTLSFYGKVPALTMRK